MHIAFSFLGTLPPCIGFAFFQSICYGWVTGKRMRTPPCRPCVFGCSGECDDFYHYAACPIIWSAYSSVGIVGHRAIQSKLRYLLVLDGQEHIYLRLAFLHAVMISVHKLRGPHSHLAVDTRQRYIQASFRDDVVRCKRL